jgi:hypothetical protein
MLFLVMSWTEMRKKTKGSTEKHEEEKAHDCT